VIQWKYLETKQENENSKQVLNPIDIKFYNQLLISPTIGFDNPHLLIIQHYFPYELVDER
jgi:hypothetical protein